MNKLLGSAAVAVLASLACGSAALAQSASATAIADLNIRSGPGPQFELVGFIEEGESATVEGCLEGSKWCRVSYEGVTGWSYSDYLTAELSGETIVLTERYVDVGLPGVTFEEDSVAGGAAAGGVTGAVVGALVGGPIGAAVGGAVGAGAGATADAAIDPPETVRTYVSSNRLDPVYLEGEVVVGAGVPETVTLSEIPDYEYRYLVINGQPVLVDPETRQIVYVIRD